MDIIQLTAIFTAATAIFTAVAASFAAYVTWQQYQLSKRQFQNELYDRRFKVYQVVQSFLSDIFGTGRTSFRRCSKFDVEVAEAEFLFEEDVVALTQELYSQGLQMAELNEQLYPEAGGPGLPVGDERNRVAKEHAELLKHMPDANSLKQTFKVYLRVY